MAGRLRTAERAQLVAALDSKSAAVYRRLTVEPLLGEAQIADRVRASLDQVRPLLASLERQGLIEKFAASERRPFGAVYRPTPDRIDTLGDWLEAGAASRGYADLASIQRDYPSVKTLADPADGADAAREQARRAAEAQERAAAQAAEQARLEAEAERERDVRLAEIAAAEASAADYAYVQGMYEDGANETDEGEGA